MGFSQITYAHNDSLPVEPAQQATARAGFTRVSSAARASSNGYHTVLRGVREFEFVVWKKAHGGAHSYRLHPVLALASISARVIHSRLECGLVQRSPHHFQARPKVRDGGTMEGYSRRCGSHRLRQVLGQLALVPLQAVIVQDRTTCVRKLPGK